MDNSTDDSPYCAIIVGAGSREGVGGAICARFAREGLIVYAATRTVSKLDALVREITDSGGVIHPVAVDVTQPDQIAALFRQVDTAGHKLGVVVFNAATLNMPSQFMSTTSDTVELMWRVCCLGGFLVGQNAIERMLHNGQGTVLFTGASASLRGLSSFGAFSAAKAGLRMHAQSMAREFGPRGIHVAHVVLDGIVNGERAKTAIYGMGKAMLFAKGRQGTLDPDAVAEAYWQLYKQHPSAWTQELDLRPAKEKF